MYDSDAHDADGNRRRHVYMSTFAFQDIDSKVESSASGGGSFNVGQLALDTGRTGGLWEPIKIQPVGYNDDKSGRFERSNSIDSHNSLSSDGFGFNARDGSGLYESQSPDSLYGSSSPTESLLETISMPPPALTRTASQPNPSADSYLYSPFKSGAASSSMPLSERKPPRVSASSAWTESVNDATVGMDGRERQQNIFAEVAHREAAPVWLSRNDSASSNSSYGGGQRFSVSSTGDGDVLDDELKMHQHNFRHASQPPVRPLSGRRALPLLPSSPAGKNQSNAGLGVGQAPPQMHESDHDRRPIPGPRPAAATAAAGAASSVSNEQVGAEPSSVRPFCSNLQTDAIHLIKFARIMLLRLLYLILSFSLPSAAACMECQCSADWFD